MERCQCGIYGADAHAAQEYLPSGSQPPSAYPVIGRVSLWGEVVECERGRLTVGPEEDGLVIAGPDGERHVESDGGREESFDWFDATLRKLAAGEEGPCTVPEAEAALEVVAGVFLANERDEAVALPLEGADAARELRIA